MNPLTWLQEQYEMVVRGFEAKNTWPENGLPLMRAQHLFEEGLKAACRLFAAFVGVCGIWYLLVNALP